MQDIYKLIKAHKKEAIKIVNHNGGKIFFYKGVENVNEEDYQKEYNKIVFDEGIDACPCVVIDDGDNGISKVRILGVKTSENNSLEFLYLDTDCGQIYWDYDENCLFNTEYYVYSYIEKQGKQKPTDKVEPKQEPKFKVGDWVVNSQGDVWHIDSLDKKNYQVSNKGEYNYFPISKQDEMHLWTIKDAKKGEVLVCRGNIKYSNSIKYERICLVNNLDNAFFTLTKFSDGIVGHGFDVNIDYPDNTVPATKEQRDLLFKKMKEDGYEWDAEKKELKKIEDENDRT